MNKSILRFMVFLFLAMHITGLHATNTKEYETYKRIVLQKGLSQSRILSIIEDQRGFMWFGTADGLNRYDGYRFKIFRNILNDSTSLPNNVINSMVEDTNGNIWIGTNRGISMFNPYTETFKSFFEHDSATIVKGANVISSCALDNNNNVWYCTAGHGIYRINANTYQTDNILYYKIDSLSVNSTKTIYIDKSNRLWIGTFIHDAILAYDINGDKIIKFPLGGFTDNGVQKINAHAFYEDEDGRVWANTIDYNGRGGSLYYLKRGSKTFANYNQFYSQRFKENYSGRLISIKSTIGDKDNNIWFASLLGGLFNFEFGDSPTAHFFKGPDTENDIVSIYRSRNGVLWIGTNGYGIEMSIPDNTGFNLMSSKIDEDFSIESIRAFAEDKNYYWVSGYYGLVKITKDFGEVKEVYPSSVYCIANSLNNENILWLGMEGDGLIQFNKTTGKYTTVKIEGNRYDQSIPGYIYAIYPYNDTILLLGSSDGLFGYNPITKTVTEYIAYYSIKNQTIRKTVRTIYKDRLGNILIGYVQGGIGKLLPDKNRIEKFKLPVDLSLFNNYNPINSIYNDKKGRYWIATNNGLMLVNGEKNVRTLTEADGLPNSHIYAVLPDEDDNLWLSTNNGISHYLPDEKIFLNYSVSDGLQNNEFNTGAYYKASDNTLFFGGISGFNYFEPAKIKRNSLVPKIVITEVDIENNIQKINKDETLAHKLTIQPDQEFFTIKFAGLSFVNSAKNRYKYKIRELNDDWVNLGNQHQITFNNMSPGTYTLEILASNNHGLWLKEPFIYTITIMPTFFESASFKWLLFALLIVVIFAGYRIRLRRITKHNERLKRTVKKQTADLVDTNKSLKGEIARHEKTTTKLKKVATDLKKSNQTKDKFLSIMAHDIINPLGVILGFTDLLSDKTNSFSNDEKHSFINIINSTAKELTTLISNLSQWSRTQRGTITPLTQKVELKGVVNNIAALLAGNITKKKIILHNNIHNETFVTADIDMLSTILRNLISNAIKYTPSGGTITISSKPHNNMVEIAIADTGVGIPKETINKLLNTDETISTKGTENEQGSGFGLALVKEFVTLSGGKMWIKSEMDIGSTFYFTLPV